MMRRALLSALLTGATALVLAGCSGFTPVYGERSALATARFNFAPPTNRVEQIILNRLAIAFPNSGSAGDPVLKVSASSTSLGSNLSNAVSVGALSATRVEASVTITQGETTLFSATRFTDTSYQGGKLTPTDIASGTGAEETAAQSTAESLRAAILAGYRPGTLIIPQR